MKKIIATSAIALGLLIPVGSAVAAAELPAPVNGTVQAATDQVVIQGPAVVGYNKMLDITGKTSPSHVGERVEIFRDGQLIEDGVRAPKVDSKGDLLVSAKSGAPGAHRYEIRLYNNVGTMTAVSNIITVHTQ